jgi:Flp pilus assembly pilin Flp
VVILMLTAVGTGVNSVFSAIAAKL